MHVALCSIPGKYKVQVYDFAVKEYRPSAPGFGMLVEVKDPDDSIVLSRVSPLSKWSGVKLVRNKISSPKIFVFVLLNCTYT